MSNEKKGSGSLEFDGLLATFHAIVWATAEDDDPDLAYDEAGNVEAKKLQAMYRAQTDKVECLKDLLRKARKSVDYQMGMQNSQIPAGVKHCERFEDLLKRIDEVLEEQ